MHSSIRSPQVIALLILIVFLVGGTIFMAKQEKSQDKSKEGKSFRDSVWWEYIQVFTVAFVLVFGFMRPFVVEAFKIPSASMENTLLIGDRILVSKFIYGIKIPFTDTHILDFHKPEVGDIFVFKPPPEAGRTQNFIKRITGLPGDVIEVKEGKLHRNGEPVEGEEYVKRLLFAIDPRFEADLDNGNVPRNLRSAFANSRSQSRLSDNVTVSIQDKGSRWELIDEGKNTKYLIRKDKDRYGLNVYIDEEDYAKRPESAKRISRDFAAFTVPPGHVFAMGDNRDQSNDSRAWGSVPFENIKGQAFLKYWSWNSDGGWLGKIRLSRIGRPVR